MFVSVNDTMTRVRAAPFSRSVPQLEQDAGGLLVACVTTRQRLH
jgi:hypothetical protein